ncbi:MAG: hypothetical protein HY897_19270 [Deltaproteobacteria bacterium]|nr:hypothetical protein [Deltaproteobacteria bacterium]
MAARLEHGHFVSMEGGSLEVAFETGSSHHDYIREDASIRRLEQILEKRFGRRFKVVIHETGAGAGSRVSRSVVEERRRNEAEQQQKVRDEAVAHPIIQDAVKVFGGRVVHSGKDGKK